MLASGDAAATARRMLAARPRWEALVGAATGAAAFVGSVALSRAGFGASEPGSRELDWIGGLLIACSTVPLVAWRRAPRAVFALTASASALLGALGYPIGLPLGPTAALYLLAASRDEEDPWTRRDTGAGVALFAGERTRLRRQRIAALRERALVAEREGERERRLAVAEERARIARDLHDAAGHAINVIAVRAGTARMRKDPERSQAALEAIEELARKTAGEIDQIVGTLRDHGSAGGAVDAPAGLASLDTLVARHAAAGLDVSVAREGEPRLLERAVDQAAYRILQEALTNAARHGTGGARVALAFGKEALELTVNNAAPGEDAPRSNGGHGLIGMRERATLLGGSLEAGRDNGWFCVRARLPYGGASA